MQQEVEGYQEGSRRTAWAFEDLCVIIRGRSECLGQWPCQQEKQQEQQQIQGYLWQIGFKRCFDMIRPFSASRISARLSLIPDSDHRPALLRPTTLFWPTSLLISSFMPARKRARPMGISQLLRRAASIGCNGGALWAQPKKIQGKKFQTFFLGNLFWEFFFQEIFFKHIFLGNLFWEIFFG